MAKKLPKPTIEEIRKYKEELVGKDGAGGFYSNLRTEQKTDQEYYDDTFKVPSITQPYRIKRIGTGSRICDLVTWHINTSNPQASREPRKAGEVEEKKAAKVTKLLNHWLSLMTEEIGEATKKANKRGEAFFQMEYNENYDSSDSDSLRIIPLSPDPMIVYPDPHEYRGVPRQLVKSCRMTISQVKQMFPKWENPKNRKLNDMEGVDYWAWWNKDWRYFEADGEALLEGGIDINILGSVPFAHCYSSYGEKSPEGKPEVRAVGLLRNLRGRLVEECEIESRIDSQIGLFTNPVVMLEQIAPDAAAPPKENELDFGPGKIIQVPFGWKITIFQGDVPSPQMFQHLYQIKQALGAELPPIAQGLPSTSRATGRQEDIYGEHYRKRFDKLIDNVERMVATSLSQGLKYLDTISGALPVTIRATEIVNGKQIRKEETITKADIDGYYDCKVSLKAEDTGASNVKFQKFRMLAGESRVTWETYLTEGLGWTSDRAKKEIIDTMVEQAWRNNPMLTEMVLRDALEEAGRDKLLAQIDEQTRQKAQQQQALATAPPAQSRPSEARNPLKRETARQVLMETPGASPRESSAGYTQGR